MLISILKIPFFIKKVLCTSEALLIGIVHLVLQRDGNTKKLPQEYNGSFLRLCRHFSEQAVGKLFHNMHDLRPHGMNKF